MTEIIPVDLPDVIADLKERLTKLEAAQVNGQSEMRREWETLVDSFATVVDRVETLEQNEGAKAVATVKPTPQLAVSI